MRVRELMETHATLTERSVRQCCNQSITKQMISPQLSLIATLVSEQQTIVRPSSRYGESE